jgi:hypothetical protein
VSHRGHDDWNLQPGNVLAAYTAQLRVVPAPLVPLAFRVECRCGWATGSEEQAATAYDAMDALEGTIQRGRDHLVAEHRGFDGDVIPSRPLLVHCHRCQRTVLIDMAMPGDPLSCPVCGAVWQ